MLDPVLARALAALDGAEVASCEGPEHTDPSRRLTPGLLAHRRSASAYHRRP